ncbi:MAG: type IX secretion system membrane protein PorP/SprF [Prolixibacteraceae bacterium]|nr:type IX secretion system membrane protein PorP/SprF [Prolixibacteraceae bacterium]
MLICFVAFCQQDPQYTNNMFYKFGVNPGVAGSDESINGIMLNRYQWTGDEKAPRTLVFGIESPLNMFGRQHGIGLNVINDKLGFDNSILIDMAYAYKVNLSFGTLGIGVSLGLFSKSMNGEWKVPEGNADIWTPASSDAAIPNGEVSQMAFNAGGGLYLSGSNYYLGVSVTHINQANIKFSDLATTFLARHYYLTGGYNIKLNDPLFEIRPSILFKTDMVSSQLDLNTNIVYNDKLWGGLTYRYQDAIALLLGVELFNGLRIGYAFDLPLDGMGKYGSHEVYVSYSLNLMTNRSRKYKSVRFL